MHSLGQVLHRSGADVQLCVHLRYTCKSISEIQKKLTNQNPAPAAADASAAAGAGSWLVRFLCIWGTLLEVYLRCTESWTSAPLRIRRPSNSSICIKLKRRMWEYMMGNEYHITKILMCYKFLFAKYFEMFKVRNHKAINVYTFKNRNSFFKFGISRSSNFEALGFWNFET